MVGEIASDEQSNQILSLVLLVDPLAQIATPMVLK